MSQSKKHDPYMVCYVCNQPVTAGDGICFIGAQPRHNGDCPKKKKVKK